jgi:predicted RNA-binding Zn-ribbon protein involved in translation (DUF1610 family)
MQFDPSLPKIEQDRRQKSPMMLFAVAPMSFTKLAAANPERTLTIGFEPNENSVEPMNAPPELPTKRTRRTARVTSAPETPAPQLLCPNCDYPLVYRQTVLGGVKPLERWDYFECRTCGPFVYRDRTRQLRSATTV